MIYSKHDCFILQNIPSNSFKYFTFDGIKIEMNYYQSQIYSKFQRE